eukprot:gene27264-biopygen7857
MKIGCPLGPLEQLIRSEKMDNLSRLWHFRDRGQRDSSTLSGEVVSCAVRPGRSSQNTGNTPLKNLVTIFDREVFSVILGNDLESKISKGPTLYIFILYITNMIILSPIGYHPTEIISILIFSNLMFLHSSKDVGWTTGLASKWVCSSTALAMEEDQEKEKTAVEETEKAQKTEET